VFSTQPPPATSNCARDVFLRGVMSNEDYDKGLYSNQPKSDFPSGSQEWAGAQAAEIMRARQAEWDLQAREAMQNSLSGSNSSSSSVAYAGGSATRGSSGSKSGFGKLVMLGLIVCGFWLYFSSSTPPSALPQNASRSVDTPPAPKPSPYQYAQRPEVSTNIPHADPTGTSAAPEPTVPSAPVGTVSTATGPQPYGLQFLAEHKGARHGCKDGVLRLTPNVLVFLCRTDQNKSFSVDSSQIKGTDDDGIEALSNEKHHSEKYHFKITGKSPEEVNQLFADWIAKAAVVSATQVRTEPTNRVLGR
jgi:hypothetical protein